MCFIPKTMDEFHRLLVNPPHEVKIICLVIPGSVLLLAFYFCCKRMNTDDSRQRKDTTQNQDMNELGERVKNSNNSRNFNTDRAPNQDIEQVEEEVKNTDNSKHFTTNTHQNQDMEQLGKKQFNGKKMQSQRTMLQNVKKLQSKITENTFFRPLYKKIDQSDANDLV